MFQNQLAQYLLAQDNCVPRKRVFGKLACWVALWITLSAIPVSGMQEEKLSESDTKKNTDSEADEIVVNQAGQIQTFRFRRSHSINGKSVDRVVERIVVQTGSNNQNQIQIQTHQPSSQIKQIQNISRDIKLDDELARRLRGSVRSGGRQIIVEMKKVTDREKEFSIGEIAPSSWIQSDNGIVHLFTDSLDRHATEPARYWIGVRCQEYHDLKEQVKRLVVKDVVRNSSAEKAGIRKADWIVDWNQKPLSTVDGLVKMIQKNQRTPAKVGILRNGSRFDLEVVPKARNDGGNIRTIIAPAARVQLAQQRIDELQKLVSVSANGQNQQVRLLLVGPGVNFGKAEIELQVSRDVQHAKSHLSKLLDRVADKQFGLIFEDDSVTLKKAPDASGQPSLFNFEPHEIWETMEIGVKGHSIPMAHLVPKVVFGEPSRLELSPEMESHSQLKRKSIHQLKTGQIVFPNPLFHFDVHFQQELDTFHDELHTLKGENLRIRSENRILKDQINKLKAQLKQQN